MFCGGDGVPLGGVHDHDAPLAGGGDIHVVQADAGPADDLQFVGGCDDIGGDPGGASDGQAVVLADDPFQLFRRQVGIDIHFDAGGFLE